MTEYIDQMNTTIRLENTPGRIVSLVPSQTEFLYDIGLSAEVVGITKFCIYPDQWFRTKTRIGGTKNVAIEKVRALRPDLIIGNREENTKEDIEKLREIAPVWMSDIYTVEDACLMMREIGEMTGKKSEADRITEKVETEFGGLTKHSPGKGKTFIYLIWKDPYYAAGKSTFIDDVLCRMGFINLLKGERYPEWNAEEIPDFIFLSTEPYPFKDKHVNELSRRYPSSKIMLVDGEMFSWYGSRLIYTVPYSRELFKTIIP